MSLKKQTITYGSDKFGLVWGYYFKAGTPAIAVTAQEIDQFLAQPDSSVKDDFLWLHFSLSNSASELWLRRNLDLPDAFYDSLHSESGSTRIEQEAGKLVVHIHDVLYDVKLDPSAIATASLCIAPRLMVSIRLRPLKSIDELKAEVLSGEVFNSPIQLLAQLLRDQAGVLASILQQTTLRVNQIEDNFLSNRISVSRSELGSLRRTLVRLQRLLAPEPASFFRLLNRPAAWISKEDTQYLQLAAEEFSAAVDDTSSLVERIKLIQEELTAHVNEQANRTLYVLTVVTVLALPVNIIAGLFGMNVGGIPLASNEHGWFVVAFFLVVLTALLAYLAFNNRHR